MNIDTKSGLVKSLEKESAILIDWFANNKMKANPDKSSGYCHWE
jgi:hypothetical protein